MKQATHYMTINGHIVSGAPDRIRTYDLRLRRPLLYPAELRAQRDRDSIISI